MRRSPYRVPSTTVSNPGARGHSSDERALAVVWGAAWLAGLCYVALTFVQDVPFDAPRSVAGALVVLAPLQLLVARVRTAE